MGSDVTDFSIGNRVVIDPNFQCGTCRSCQKGLTNLYDGLGAYGVIRHGGFAEFSVVQQENVIPIGDLVIDATGVPEVAQNLIDYTANGGNVLLFGVCPPDATIALSPHDIFRR